MFVFLSKIEKVLLFIERFIVIVIGITLPCLVTLSVIFRYILKSDLFGIEEVEIYIAIWLYFIGSCLTSYSNKHVTADLTQSLIKSFKIRKFFAIVSSFLAFCAVAAFAYWSLDMVQYAWLRDPKTPAWGLHLVGEYVVVPISFVIMACYCLRDFYRAVTRKDTKTVQSA